MDWATTMMTLLLSSAATGALWLLDDLGQIVYNIYSTSNIPTSTAVGPCQSRKHVEQHMCFHLMGNYVLASALTEHHTMVLLSNICLLSLGTWHPQHYGVIITTNHNTWEHLSAVRICTIGGNMLLQSLITTSLIMQGL